MRWRRRDDNDDDFEDDSEEGAAENLAVSAYTSVLLRKAVWMGLMFAGFLAVTAADYVFGTLAVFRLPGLLAGILAGFMLGELSVFTRRWLRNRRGSRARKAARDQMTKGEKMNAALDDIAATRAKPLPKPWWMTSPLRFYFWTGLVFRGVYSSCVGLVVAGWTGIPAAGVAAGLAWTALALLAGYSARPAITSLLDAAAFIDPRPARNSPET